MPAVDDIYPEHYTLRDPKLWELWLYFLLWGNAGFIDLIESPKGALFETLRLRVVECVVE